MANIFIVSQGVDSSFRYITELFEDKIESIAVVRKTNQDGVTSTHSITIQTVLGEDGGYHTFTPRGILNFKEIEEWAMQRMPKEVFNEWVDS